MSLYAVIIAGGRGKRFWPRSRMRRPKYLLSLPGQKDSLLKQAVYKLKDVVDTKNIIIVTNKIQANEIKKEITNIDRKNIIPEPCSRNTCAAIGLAATVISSQDPDAIIIVLPADQLILENNKFRNALKIASESARQENAIFTIGIKPTFPATGFGYIRTGKRFKGDIFKADAFIEKPNLNRAKKFLGNKRYFWNGGIFVSKAAVMLDEINRYMPKISAGLKFIRMYIGTDRLSKTIERYYKNFPDISIDYAIMEKSKKVYVVKTNFQLYDMGSWKNISEIIKFREKSNIVIGKHECIDTKNSIIMSNDSHLIGTIGLNDVIIIHTDDATLVCRKDKSELVKNLVEKIEKKGLSKFL